MAKKTISSYAEAMAELETIMQALQNGQLDVDDMVKQVQRASELIAFCQKKLTQTQTSLQEVLKNGE